MKLSVLDVLPVTSDRTPTEALQGAADLAVLADELGYERLWYAEHHGMGGIASAVPELLIAHTAPLTKRIRVGAGGVMLPNHAPLRVVEQYRTLAALHPGRIDLGIGRASGTDPVTARALRAVGGGEFAQSLTELLTFDGPGHPANHPYGRVKVTPEGVPLPPMWMLGSSGGSARIAGQLGTGYAFAGHFAPVPAAPAVQAYKASFRPSEHFPEPKVILALSVIVGPTAEEARELSSTFEMVLRSMYTGQVIRGMSPADCRAAGWHPSQPLSASGPMGRLLIVGDPTQVRERIEDVAKAAGADEVMAMTIVFDPEARHESYRMLAKAFDLQGV